MMHISANPPRKYSDIFLSVTKLSIDGFLVN